MLVHAIKLQNYRKRKGILLVDFDSFQLSYVKVPTKYCQSVGPYKMRDNTGDQ